MKTFEQVCKANSLKITPQRTAIYKLLEHDTSHPTADMVYREIRKTFPTISFDTVNRTLVQFTQIGLLSPLACSGTSRRYDPNTSGHHHFKCLKCGAVKDVFYEPFNEIKFPNELLEDFEVQHQSIVISGLCKNCSTKKGEN